MESSNTRYTKVAIILHWLIALAIFAMFALGWYMTDLPKEAPKAMSFDLFDWGVYTWHLAQEASPRAFYYNLHKSVGVTILALVLLRLLWRITHKPPALLPSLKAWEKKLAHAGHHSLYLLMFAMPITGVIMTLYSKFGLSWFGVPLLKGLDNNAIREQFAEIHEVVGVILIVVIVIHVLGAVKHKLIDKDDTLKRMSLR
jgi:cytochrome b561